MPQAMMHLLAIGEDDFYWLLAIAGFVGIVVVTFVFIASRYRRCPSDRILVVYGRVKGGQSANCIHGGGVLVWPLIQDYAYLSLRPMTISIPLENALSLQNIRINVPSTFTVGISTSTAIMSNAAERLLGISPSEIEDMAREIIFGQLRLTVASLTIEQINQDRESFLTAIRANVEPELNKIGLYLINVNITDITDESDYIASIGKKAAAEAINRAKIDVAEQDKLGSIGESEAERERAIRVAENLAQADKGKKKAEADKRIYVQSQEAEAVGGENEARATIAASEAELAVRKAEAKKRGEIARSEAEVDIQRALYAAEQERLNAEEIVREEIDKRKIEIAAEARAEEQRKVAQGEADAILARYEAEAKGVRQVLESKGEGYRQMVSSCGGDARAAATLLLVEKIEEIVSRQVEAIQNLKIDKITVWDSGNGNGDRGGTTTSNFLSGLVRSLPPLHELAGMAGVDLPDYLGRLAEGRGVSDNGGEAPARQTSPEPSSPDSAS